MRIKSIHCLQWIAEPLEGHSSFMQKKMFGCEAVYLHGKQMFVLAAHEEPWNGLLVCTSHEYHASLMADYPALKPHSVLGKWLYVSQAHVNFEEAAAQIAARVLRADSRIGVESKPRKKKRSGRKNQS